MARFERPRGDESFSQRPQAERAIGREQLLGARERLLEILHSIKDATGEDRLIQLSILQDEMVRLRQYMPELPPGLPASDDPLATRVADAHAILQYLAFELGQSETQDRMNPPIPRRGTA